jgi:hypothetical protein
MSYRGKVAVPKSTVGAVVLSVSLTATVAWSGLAQALEHTAAPAGAQPQIAGTWRGNSVCAVAGSPCREENVYRFSEIAGTPGRFSVTGSKIVDGKEIVMGTGEWTYDGEQHVVQSESPVGIFRLTVQGNTMEGGLTVRNNTLYRRIHLTRQ